MLNPLVTKIAAWLLMANFSIAGMVYVAPLCAPLLIDGSFVFVDFEPGQEEDGGPLGPNDNLPSDSYEALSDALICHTPRKTLSNDVGRSSYHPFERALLYSAHVSNDLLRPPRVVT